MEKEYTYHPAKITDGGINQMRFELGDTLTEGKQETCILCDAEYKAMIEKETSFKRARLMCLKAIVRKLSYEVDYSADKISISLSERYPRWKAFYEEEKKAAQAASFFAGNQQTENKHYFVYGLHQNPNT